ncbi:MAG TPA: YaiI/YqxD family protein [Steroidobacteraceae bacterium]|nr:YaiI/YqxD family protein [Steroidobacteraceae bacterium]
MRSEGQNVAGASIWVDADACPGVIKEILFRAAQRTGVSVTLIANQPLSIPRLSSVRLVQVSSGFDVADAEIVKRVIAGDLVVTADIPLAAEVIAKGGEALNPRGERYLPDTIHGVLAMRDFMDTMRSIGHVGGGPPPLTQANRNAFAAHLDSWLARRVVQH